MSKPITTRIKENMAQAQRLIDETIALAADLEKQATALIGAITEDQPEKRRPQIVKAKSKAPAKTAKAGPTAVALSGQIKDAAIALARGNTKRHVRVEAVLDLLRSKGGANVLPIQKPNSLIGSTLSRTPGFTKVSSGLYLYQPGKGQAPKKPKAGPAETAPPGEAPATDEEKCPKCELPLSQCTCAAIGSAMAAVDDHQPS